MRLRLQVCYANFPHSTQFFGWTRNLRLRRFGHASPYSPKNRAPFGCASREGIAAPFALENLCLAVGMLVLNNYLYFQVALRV